ncbi:hypothetical protein Pla123a_33500 [Posidoniimonas polymericola]|uniref:PEP-CTERM protein-sorting domain-containing protein n=1 Tax=Posidoniimonas polymericola TaxID=2528002 RepID=A0A5C5YFP3_9BACT|nr:PEP-CTERM sorting domain-containing protein [Posidoniimonas polymericola]TWT74527.1 hypothetical protein Pla123a_33500 [Posidoniimonas polymericola]
MHNKKHASETSHQNLRSKLQIAKQISSYTAAAGLGAFAFGESVDAAIVYTDVPDIVVNQDSPTGGYFDMDGDGVDDFRFRFNNGGGGLARIRFQGVAPSADLSNSPAKGSTYYVRSFELGDLIGPGTPEANNNGIVTSNLSNFGNPTDPQFAGIKLDIGGATHFGWVRVKTEPVDLSTGYGVAPLTGTIFDWAFESEPDTPIAAGATPEPSSLALLAAGVGALIGASRSRSS